MNRRVLAVVVVFVCSGLLLGEAAPAGKPGRPEGGRVYINLSGVTLESVVQYISDFTGKHVLLPDPFIGDKPVDIVSSPRAGVPRDAQMEIFATALRAAGYTMLEQEHYIQIVPEGRVDSVPLRESLPEVGPVPGGLVMSVVDVKNADVTRLLPLLQNLKSRVGKVVSYADANKLVITEYDSNFQAMLSLVRNLDKEWAGSVVEHYKLQNTSAEGLQGVVTSYVNNLASGATPVVKKRLDAFSVYAHRPTNSLLLFGHPEDITKVKQLIGTLDVRPAETARSFHMYMVLNRDASELVTVLDGVLAAAAKARGKAAAAEPPVSVRADQTNNAIIVIATPDKYAQLLPLIQQLDRPKAQVLIECALVEMSTDRLLDLGVELATLDKPGDRPRGFAGTAFGVSAFTEDGRVPILPAVGGLIAGVFKDGVFNIAALIRLAEKDDEVSFIAAPMLMASDGTDAVVDIGERREFLKSIVSPEGRTSEVTSGGFHEAKIELKITPYINEEGTIRLKIEQRTEQFLPSTETAAGVLTNITTRYAKTEVNVPDGRTVVIAGLTGTTQVTRESKVPVLGHIPVLGFFFRRKEVINQQRNLCVFITPRIMSSDAALAAETQRRKDELRDIADSAEHGFPEETFEKVTGGKPGPKKKSE